MNAAVVLIISLVVLAMGYIFYGGWLVKQWGIDPEKKTPAHELKDGLDYFPAKTPVLMGHHFSSIAGAGPINGPIQAAVFGWVPAFLWIVIGGVFFGGVHDFGALFASIRHKGRSIGVVIDDTMGKVAKKHGNGGSYSAACQPNCASTFSAAAHLSRTANSGKTHPEDGAGSDTT